VRAKSPLPRRDTRCGERGGWGNDDDSLLGALAFSKVRDFSDFCARKKSSS
jgi:hypothetical protein